MQPLLKRSLRPVARPQTHCSVLLKASHVWWSAPVSFQAGLCGQLGSLSLGSKLFSSGSDLQDGKDPFDTDQVQLWSLNHSLLPCEFSPKWETEPMHGRRLRGWVPGSRRDGGRGTAVSSKLHEDTPSGLQARVKRGPLNRNQILLPCLSRSPLSCKQTHKVYDWITFWFHSKCRNGFRRLQFPVS